MGGKSDPQALSKVYSLVCLFIYLFMAALGLRCCTQAFSSCSEQGLLLVVVRGLLTEVTLLRSMGSRRAGFSSCGMWAQ